MDTDLVYVINHLARSTSWAHPLVSGYATYGVVLVAGLLIVGWWIARGTSNPASVAAAWCAGASAMIALAVNQPIVDVVARPRPYATHPDLLVLVSHSSDWSFPSDHATVAGAAAAGLFLVSRRLGFLAGLAALAMAFSRVYVSAHYPSDVVAGLALGAVISVIVYLLARQPAAAVAEVLAQTRWRPLVCAPRRAG